ncbi:hypothetical protein L1987_06087 [Smallanthus sonchifolius]|uniref:Uncharacterized protein n=1 Tax=Smallanthus sonchifolius TaxID=185202 RepID=A0ACB9JX73_9ASTR|nr:hypothetical protein L1987_06087 [Smallanthus sonchifolius]
MEEDSPPPILEGKITGISFSLATRQEICLASISDCPISHASQLSNPFLGLPLEVGRCESYGAAEVGKCEGHFGYIDLPIPIYHPSHINELKRILSLICLKCLKFKNQRLQSKNVGVLERTFAFCCDCEEAAQVTVNENQKKDGACFLELKLPSRRGIRDGFWDFLDRYGYRYGGHATTRPLLPSEVLKILKKIPEATKKKLAGRGCVFQEGYIMQHLPVPPNCLSTPDVSDGITVTSSDISMPMLKKVLRQVEIIKSSRSGAPNFESLEVEVNDLQLAVAQYLHSRGAKASPDKNTRYVIARTANDSSSTKAWLEKMKTLFISKGSGFSSRSIITGDPYKGVGEIGIPFEIAQRITFEERVTEHNMKFLQKLVDEKLCLTYRDGQSTYSLREGSKGHTFLKPGEVASKNPISDFILRFSSMGNLIDPKSDSALTRIVQQVGFLGLQIYERGRLYSKTLAEDLSSLFVGNYPFPKKYPYEEFGLIRSCLFNGLDPYEELVHSVANREVMIRSSRGLTEPGILFKNSMAILRDVVICYDGTVRNVCSNSVIQFEYGAMTKKLFAAGEPVGVLAATAMSNPAYKAVLDSSPSSNSSWNMMKEILQCGVNFKNVHNDRRVVLYFNDCDCGKEHCRENAAFKVKDHLRKVSLKDVAVEFLIEYRRQQVTTDNVENDAGLVGHIHLNKTLLKDSNISMEEVLIKCEDALNSFHKKKKLGQQSKKEVGQLFKKIAISCSECSFQQSSEWIPCLKFFLQDIPDIHLEKTAQMFAETVCPVLLNSIIKGDPRVKEANITWISPETTAWIKNPLKDQKGEIAIDVILEKGVKKSGDAWRTVMDACLPVIHLIDTTRSIPYAIKQVEHLLGIACAFEQVVQRLSISVSMVTKGMLKEHLLLLASSMTCAGFLVGFNLAGIKALNKMLNFQVPFSEATVYTPKRCFEKAAEKCYADSLSSIVGACSWGKPVAVGTGSRFDILWDTREVELNQKYGIDVYNFLHLVGGGSKEAVSGCLGGDVDSFDLEDNFMETGSPEVDSGLGKPVFEDGLALNLDVMDVEQSTWGTCPAPVDGTSSGGCGGAVKTTPAIAGGWGEAKSDQGQQTGSWGGWGATRSQKDVEPSGTCSSLGDDNESGWGANKSENETDKGSGAWGQTVAKGDKPPCGATKSQNEAEKEPESGSWGQKVVKEDGPWWGGNKSRNDTEKGSGLGWGQKMVTADEPGWSGKKSENDTNKGSGSGWGQKVVTADEPGWGGKKSENDTNKGSGSGSWSQKVVKSVGSGWNGKPSEPPVDQAEIPKGSSGSWGKPKDKIEAQSWSDGGKVQSGGEEQKGSWTSWGKKNEKTDVSLEDSSAGGGEWGKKDSCKTAGGSSSSSWGKSIQKSYKPSWNKSVEAASESAENDKWGSSENKTEGSDWSKKVEEKTDSKGGWGQKKDQVSGTDGSTEKGQEVTEQNPGSWGWNRKAEQKPDQGGGWRKKENWGPKRDRPARPVGGPNDGPRSGGGPYTASRQRLDMFTSDEQEILTDVEPIMQSVRRIMSQTGYNDGDPLSADDQTYILENVFTHHPDKAQKAGAGVDYIMVTKHTKFQDSRCFFVVSTDGRKEDFSYRKCLENFVRGKYPNKVDEFISKYFRKPQPRPPRDETGTPRSRAGWNRDSGVVAGTPSSQSTWKRETSLAADETAPPVSEWKKEASSTPAAGWNQGWKKEGGAPATEGGGTQKSGWDC